ncbi:acyltransferase, partial [Parabacteroides distasonis]
AIVGVLSLQLEWFYPAVSKDLLYGLTRPLWVMATLALLLSQSYSSRLFTWVGSYAYIIYLYHGFGTSGGRIILNRLGVSSEILIFMFATAMAIFIPVILQRIANRNKILRFLTSGT